MCFQIILRYERRKEMDFKKLVSVVELGCLWEHKLEATY